MANPEHLEILKQGVEVWNQWRKNHSYIRPDLSEADMHKRDLYQVNLRQANMEKASLEGADLRSADLREANLRGANLSVAMLSWTDMSKTILAWANLSQGLLDGTNLTGADLYRASLHEAYMIETNLEKVMCSHTIFADLDLSTAKGLDTVIHMGPSTIGVDTIFKSKGKIPEKFLRGCGVPENLITYLPSLLGEAIQFYSCFISYSHTDKDFANRLYDRLQGEGIRCWLDEHQLNPGDPLHPTIYEAIRNYDKVLLCCSERGLQSLWVENEFNNAVRKEEDYRANVLIPLNLDGYLFTSDCTGWVADRIKQRLVADFTGWKDHDTFESAFKKVVKALRTDGGNPPPPEPKLKPK